MLHSSGFISESRLSRSQISEHVADTPVTSHANMLTAAQTLRLLSGTELSTFTVTGVCVTLDHVRMGRRTEHSILHAHTHTHTINASCLPLIRAQFSGRQDALVVGGERSEPALAGC